ncbi:MAG: hypothetical protein M3Y59_18290 [Myxococcota bacterium]|nr:hypothetical protein [Myxococcota bacterium]
MKFTFAVLALMLTASADELAKTQVDALDLMAPAAWKRTLTEGTTRFSAPSGEAYFELDVGTVQREGGMPAEECLGKILGGLGSEGFEKLTVGGKPAARRVLVDTDEAGKSYTTYSYVGCSGRTTWSLQFHMLDAKKDRYAKVAEQVARSIHYAKGK